MSRFSFLRKEWFDIYNSVISAEKIINEDSNSALIKLRQVVESITSYILNVNNMRKAANLEDAINLLSKCNDINSDVIELFNEIRLTGNKSVHEFYSDANLASSLLNRLFKILVWFVIEFSSEDYWKAELDEMSSECKLAFYEYLMRKQFSNDKKKIKHIKKSQGNEVLVTPFNIVEGEVFEREEYITNKNIYERDIFETKKEFYDRIKNVETLSFGNIFIELTQNNQTQDNAIFTFTIFNELPIKHPNIDLLYIDKKEFEDASIKQKKYNLIAQLDIIDDNVCIDIQRIYIKEANNKCKVNAVILDRAHYKNQKTYKDNISNISNIPLGIVKIHKYKYDIDEEILPVTINYFEWLGEFGCIKEGFIQIGRKEAKLLCEENLHFMLVGRLDVFLGELLIKHCYIESEMLSKNVEVVFKTESAKRKLYDYLVQAEKGSSDAMVKLGKMYHNGNDIEKNYKEAMKWYKKGAEKGNADSMNNIGCMYESGQGVEKDYKEAMKWYKKGAEKGNVDSMYNIGCMYDDGDGVEKDYKEAMKWYKKAAEKGNAASMYNIGCMYDDGDGVEKDYKEAMKWYKKAAKKGNAASMYNIGGMYDYEEEVEEAMKWYKKAAEKGNATSMHNIGYMYEIGRGVEKDYKEAIKWYKKSAGRDNVDSMLILGAMYYDGEGVEVDYKEAMKWYKKAAGRDNVDSMLILGAMYYNGEGVEVDYKEAMKWYEKSAEWDNVDSMFILGVMYHNGEGVEKDYKEAMKWYKKAAEKGNVDSMYNIGFMYEIGQGVEIDYKEAMKWYKKGAEKGDADSMNNIGRMYQSGRGVEVDYKEAMKWYKKAEEKDSK